MQIGGILRVGGRLSRAPLPDESRHQIIISKDSPLAVLLIRFFEEKSGYSGREYVLALLRERFWLVRANTTARSVLSSCFQSKRRHGLAGEENMADFTSSQGHARSTPLLELIIFVLSLFAKGEAW